MTDFETINNQTSNETSIKINYNQGMHDLTITGTYVMPEFPSSYVSVIIFGAAIGLIIMTLSKMQYLAK